MAEMVLFRVLRCHNCRREMTCSFSAYEENPFCTNCLNSRIAEAAPSGGVRWKRAGQYFIPEAAPRGEYVSTAQIVREAVRNALREKPSPPPKAVKLAHEPEEEEES